VPDHTQLATDNRKVSVHAPQGDQAAEPNLLLRAIPAKEYERLVPQLEPVMLDSEEVLYEPNEPISAVYFLGTGVASMVSIMRDGATVEVSTVGNEGLVGVPVLLGALSMPTRCFLQVPGDGKRMEVGLFATAVVEHRQFRSLLLRYTQVLFNQVAQSAACNRAHAIEQRCARWLLMTHDRVTGDVLPLTHEFLGYMLGVRRESVSVAAEALQRSGLIEYRRGKISIRDRPGLEAASCECYAVVRASLDALFNGTGPSHDNRGH
jgi:CRP-like cAMP-binding protein